MSMSDPRQLRGLVYRPGKSSAYAAALKFLDSCSDTEAREQLEYVPTIGCYYCNALMMIATRGGGCP
jgi:hypothetical protein